MTLGRHGGRSDRQPDRWPSGDDGVGASHVAVLDAPSPQGSLFAPAAAVSGDLGDGRRPGAGARLPWQSAADRPNPWVRWWEVEEYAELGRAVEEVFADPTPTGELVRPYVVGGTPGVRWPDAECVPPPVPVDESSTQEPALRHISDFPSRVESGRLGTRARAHRPTPLPERVTSRRELRERERSEGTARAIAARRLAKGGVLAVTVFGVVATTAPHLAHRLAVGGQTAAAAQDSLSVGLVEPAVAAEGAQGRGLITAAEAPAQVGSTVAELLQARLVKESAQAQQVGAAAKSAGAAALAVAVVQARAEQQQRQVEIDRASRDAVRDPKALARVLVAERGWSSAQFSCLDLLWKRESGWNYRAYNASSGAYGIPQALPGSKMSSVASDWRTNPATQITWGLNYIKDRYSTPCGAWAHSQSTGWY